MNVKVVGLGICVVFLFSMHSFSQGQSLAVDVREIPVETELLMQEALEKGTEVTLRFYSGNGNRMYISIENRDDLNKFKRAMENHPPKPSFGDYKSDYADPEYVKIYLKGEFYQNKEGTPFRKSYYIRVKASELNDEIMNVVDGVSSNFTKRTPNRSI